MTGRTLTFLLPCLLVAGACGDHDNLDRALERMIEQPRCEPNQATPWFDDSSCNRQPPLGTVPWYGSGPALVELESPGERPADMNLARLVHGRELFETYCSVCHGVLGLGESQVAENMALRKPPSLHEPRVAGRSDAHLFNVISAGYGLMPSYSRALSPPERWEVVAYVRVLQLSQAASLTALPAAMQQEAKRWLQ